MTGTNKRWIDNKIVPLDNDDRCAVSDDLVKEQNCTRSSLPAVGRVEVVNQSEATNDVDSSARSSNGPRDNEEPCLTTTTTVVVPGVRSSTTKRTNPSPTPSSSTKVSVTSSQQTTNTGRSTSSSTSTLPHSNHGVLLPSPTVLGTKAGGGVGEIHLRAGGGTNAATAGSTNTGGGPQSQKPQGGGAVLIRPIPLKAANVVVVLNIKTRARSLTDVVAERENIGGSRNPSPEDDDDFENFEDRPEGSRNSSLYYDDEEDLDDGHGYDEYVDHVVVDNMATDINLMIRKHKVTFAPPTTAYDRYHEEEKVNREEDEAYDDGPDDGAVHRRHHYGVPTWMKSKWQHDTHDRGGGIGSDRSSPSAAPLARPRSVDRSVDGKDDLHDSSGPGPANAGFLPGLIRPKALRVTDLLWIHEHELFSSLPATLARAGSGCGGNSNVADAHYHHYHRHIDLQTPRDETTSPDEDDSVSRVSSTSFHADDGRIGFRINRNDDDTADISRLGSSPSSTVSSRPSL